MKLDERSFKPDFLMVKMDERGRSAECLTVNEADKSLICATSKEDGISIELDFLIVKVALSVIEADFLIVKSVLRFSVAVFLIVKDEDRDLVVE